MRSELKLARARHRARRRTFSLVGVGAAVAVGAAALTGLASAPLSAPDASGAVLLSSPADAVASVSDAAIDALTMSETDARGTLVAGRAALDAAGDLSAEIAASGLDIGTDASIDTSSLAASIEKLQSVTLVPMLLFPELAENVQRDTGPVLARTAELRGALDVAVAKKAADDAAAAAAAEAQRQAEAAAAALAQANTPDGARATARALASERYGWGEDQFSCLSSLWQKESSWNYRAYNDSSGATGIPQALPGDKMAAAGADWQTSAATQIAWGLDYIDRAYGTPCAAWGHSQATNWY